MVIVDYFSGWVEAPALKNDKTESVLNALSNNWICRYGIPQYIITDNGNQFVGRVAKQFYEQMGIHKKRTSSYHPQSDGLAERTIGSIKKIIKSNLEDVSEWDDYLETACMAIRSAQNHHPIALHQRVFISE